MLHTRTPSNIARKRMPASGHHPTPTLGDVAPIQALFQSAKASLRVDMAFAASPDGSISSRLPSDNSPASQSESQIGHSKIAKAATARKWRYSTAPRLVAAAEQDVREPVPLDFPALPGSLPSNTEDNSAGLEPMSSGFASPVDHKGYFDYDSVEHPPLATSDATFRVPNENFVAPIQSDELDFVHQNPGLEQSMLALHVGSDDVQGETKVEQRKSSTHGARDVREQDGNDFFISENAKAAADSAKARRGLTRSLIPWRWSRANAAVQETAMNTEYGALSTEASTMNEADTPIAPAMAPTISDDHSSIIPCPDPSLHKLLEMGICPDPNAHSRHSRTSIMVPHRNPLTPPAADSLAAGSPLPWHQKRGLSKVPFQRATATGSLMPFTRIRNGRGSPDGVYDSRRPDFHHSAGRRPSVLSHQGSWTRNSSLPHSRQLLESEHFRPGWYYARESIQPAKSKSPMEYSFSTAAAKEGGQSITPASEIRDSYRTDTLTTLSKPPNRFRKTGIGAIAGARGVNRHYFDEKAAARPASRMTCTGTGTSKMHRYPDSVQFRSSPPRIAADMAPGLQKRRRPQDLEEEHIDILDDNTGSSDIAGSSACLERSSEVISVDENTRAAVRLSLYGRDNPDVRHAPRQGIMDLSSNVVYRRKGTRQPRKKRRSSYWDGDLKQVRESPAAKVIALPRQEIVRSLHRGPARQVMTSPAEEEINSVKGEQARITPDGPLEMEEVQDHAEDKENEGYVGPGVHSNEAIEGDGG